jgi:hypothetical protein
VAVEEGWQRRHPHVQLDREAMRWLLGVAVLDSEVLKGGLRNTNYKLPLAGEDRPVLLRLYTAEAVVSVCVRRRQTPATRQPNCVTATSGGALLHIRPKLVIDEIARHDCAQWRERYAAGRFVHHTELRAKLTSHPRAIHGM